MRPVGIAAIAALALGAVALAGVGRPDPAQGQQPQPALAGITVNGMGAVTTRPNRAELSFGVVSQATTARAAVATNAAEMRRVIDALKAAGIDADDIQTQQVSLFPRNSEEGETIVGYTAQNTVSARVEDLGRTGVVIDAAVAAGANSVSGPTLSRSDSTELYRTALRAALADARAKAQTLAAASGLPLGSVRNVVESGSSPGPLPIAQEDAARTAAPPIEPGTQRLEATVTVTFALG